MHVKPWYMISSGTKERESYIRVLPIMDESLTLHPFDMLERDWR